MVENTSLPAVTPVKAGFPSASSTPTFAKATVGEFTRLVTNDLYFAAYLLCEGYPLDRVYHNGRKRCAFVFAGEGILEKKKAYKQGKVFLNVGSFREKLKQVRQMMDNEQRSLPCPSLKPHPQTEPQPA